MHSELCHPLMHTKKPFGIRYETQSFASCPRITTKCLAKATKLLFVFVTTVRPCNSTALRISIINFFSLHSFSLFISSCSAPLYVDRFGYQLTDVHNTFSLYFQRDSFLPFAFFEMKIHLAPNERNGEKTNPHFLNTHRFFRLIMRHRTPTNCHCIFRAQHVKNRRMHRECNEISNRYITALLIRM